MSIATPFAAPRFDPRATEAPPVPPEDYACFKAAFYKKKRH